MRRQCSLPRFKQVLAILRKYFQFISLDEAVSMISGEIPVRPYCAVLTFDDGYRNNYLAALPVLQQYSIPATFFLPTGHITNKKPFWFDTLDYFLQKGKLGSFTLSIAEDDVCFATGNRDKVKDQYRRFLYQYNRQFYANDSHFQKKIYAQIDSAGKISGDNVETLLKRDPRTALMSWDEVGECVQTSDITMGSHSVDHLRLASLDEEHIRQQLVDSKNDIEQHIGRKCRHLCYPNGSYDERVINIGEECGYKAAVTTVSGLNTVGDDVFGLCRIGLPLRADKFHILSHIYRKR